MVDTYLASFQDNIFGANVFKLRTIIRLLVEYYTCCRGADYIGLQAPHFERGGEDQLH